MADKNLQSITFPGLTDKYVVPQVDNTLTQAGRPADAKKTGDEISELKADLTQLDETAAKIDGSYDDLTAGNAKQLESTQYVEDSEPYLHRTSGGSSDIGNREDVRAIVGGSVVWNQSVQNGNFAYGTTGWGAPTGYTMSVSDNIMTLTYVDANSSAALTGNTLGTIEGHKYLASAQVKFDKNPAQAPFLGSGGYQGVMKNITAGSWKEFSGIFERATGGNDRISFYPRGTSGAGWVSGDTIQIKDIICVDLTAMLPTAIADYVYSLEQSEAGSGIAWLRKYGFFMKDYYEYCAPDFRHVQGLVSHDTVGFNQWDMSTENVGKALTTGGELLDSANYCTSDYIRVIPNTNYYLKGVVGSSYGYASAWYDSDKNFIKNISVIGASYEVSGIVTSPSDAMFVRCTRRITSLEPCINLSWSGTHNGEYQPYEKHSYPLDPTVVLRGFPKLDASGNLYYDGDRYLPDGTVTRKYGIVDLGTLSNYVANGLNNVYVNIPGKKVGSDNVKSDQLEKRTQDETASAMTDDSFKTYSGNDGIAIRKGGITINNAAQMLSGVYLLYELATPTTETADPYQEVQVVNDWGTEEYVIDSEIDVPVPVGHETRYPANLRDKLQHLPDLADGDGYYAIKQVGTQMSLEPFRIPKAPETDGTYTLKATVASGTPTYTWESEVTEG